MMRGRLYIDGLDAFDEFGVFVKDGGLNALLAFPPLKTPDNNDWQEEDGLEVDLSAPVLNTRDVQLKFHFREGYSRFYSFIEQLSDGAYHEFNFASIGRTFRLRLTSQSSASSIRGLGEVALKFSDDFPLSGYTYVAPQSTGTPSDGYSLDNRDFAEYGVRVLKGTLDELLKQPNTKTKLQRSIKSLAGVIYDGDAPVTYKSRDMKISCLLRATDFATLWRNYDALLYDLTRPDERVLRLQRLDKGFPCMYKSCQVNHFLPSGRIWLEFTLTLTLISAFGLKGDEGLLASEALQLITTEDGQSVISITRRCGVDI